MVFNANLVAVIKQNGKILRETKSDGGYNINNRVYIPFGAEYTILLKNLNTRKALVTVEIDGREAISDLIVHPNSNVELERFFEDNMDKGRKFRFIEKTDNIRNYRGDKIEDGIVRITYQFEEPNFWHTRYTYWSTFTDQTIGGGGNTWGGSSGDVGDNITTPTYTSNSKFVDNSMYELGNVFLNCSNQVNEDGITVEGDYSDQSFVYGNIGPLDPELHCINIELKGQYPNKGEVKKPLTTKTKTRCEYCGKLNTSKNKFCPDCGAALI